MASPTRSVSDFTTQIASGQALTAAPVSNALSRIVTWFTTTAGLGISNSDIATDAEIATTKMKHGSVALNTFLNAGGEHNTSDGTHTQVSQGITNLIVSANSTNPTYQVDISADYITALNSAGSKTLVGIDVNGSAETISETISITTAADTMDDTDGSSFAASEEASKTYTIVCLRDLTTGGVYTTKFVFYSGTALDSAFYATDLAGYNTRVSGNYTHAKIVGAVFNNGSKDLEIPRPIGGGSMANSYLPSPTLFTVGSYTGNGTSQTLTGLGFKPDYLIIQGYAASYVPVHTSSTLIAAEGTKSYTLTGASSPLSNGITAMDADGFSIGSYAGVNNSGTTFYYMAWKRARDFGLSIGGTLTD